MGASARTYDEETAPPATDAAGFQLDQWGLPLSGPRRRAALAEANKRDPREHPEDWTPAAQVKAAERVKAVKAALLGVDAKEAANG